MKPIKHATLVIALALLAGCATTFRPWSLSKIKEGMDRGQVVHILGEPDFVETRDGAELLHYSYRENYNPPLSTDPIHTSDAGRGFRDRELARSLKEYRYVVKMVGGKVQDYKELAD